MNNLEPFIRRKKKTYPSNEQNEKKGVKTSSIDE